MPKAPRPTTARATSRRAKDALEPSEPSSSHSAVDTENKTAATTPAPREPAPALALRTASELLTLVGEVSKATSGPMLDPPSAYSFEIKYDGYRLLASKALGDVRLVSRRKNDWTGRFATIADALAKLSARDAVIDGEACAVDASGTPSFGRLQQWLSGERQGSRLVYAAFDLLWLDGRDLRRFPLEERRSLLASLLDGEALPLCFSTAIEGELPAILAAAKKAGLEGLVAKRKGSFYVAGYTTSWRKLKFEQRQDYAVCGWTPQTGTNVLGALILGLREGDGFVFAGKAGTGFDEKTRRELVKRLEPLRTDKPTLTGHDRLPTARWCKPELVADVSFLEYSRHGLVRNPVFIALREDKTCDECVRDSSPPDLELAPFSAPPPAAASRRSSA